ncbi:MAG: VanZ family protein [Gemmatimonadota bacterium]
MSGRIAARAPVSRARARVARTVGLLSAALIAAVTLTPQWGDASQPLWCITCGRWLQDGVDNVVLFVPLGVALALSGWHPVAALAIGFVGSSGIEVAQHYAVPGRDTSILDVLTNATGTWLGAAAYSGRWWWPQPATARRLVALGVLPWAGHLMLDSLALRWPPRIATVELMVRRRPVADDTIALGFRLLETRLANEPFEWTLDTARVARALEASAFRLQVRGVVLHDAPDGFLTSGVYGRARAVVGVVTVERGMARGRPAQRAAEWGLVPAYAETQLPAVPRRGDTVEAIMYREMHGVSVEARLRRAGTTLVARGAIEPSVRRSWRLLVPEWVSRRLGRVRLLDVLWLVGPAVVIAIWTVAGAAPTWLLAVPPSVAMGTTIWVTRYASGVMSYALWWDWVAAMLAYAIALIVASRLRNGRAPQQVKPGGQMPLA